MSDQVDFRFSLVNNAGQMNIFRKITNNLTTSALLAALITSIITLGYQWYLRPRIILDYSGLYATVKAEVIGSVDLINLGRNVEEGMTVRINTAVQNIDDVSVLINQVPTEQKIVLRPDFTDIVIDKLYPEDEAFISFKPQNTDTTSFDAYHFGRNMRTSRYEDLEWTAEWWEINQIQLAALVVIFISSVLLGTVLNKTKSFVITKIFKEIHRKP